MKTTTYTTSTGWVIDLRKLHSDDRTFIRECEDDAERQTFIDQVFETYGIGCVSTNTVSDRI